MLWRKRIEVHFFCVNITLFLMKFLDQTLYLEFSELIDCGISENTVKKASERKSPSWDIIAHPDDGRKRLIGFEKLREDYKVKVTARYGNPYEYFAKTPIRQMVIHDLEAEKFYLGYRYDGDKKLPEERVRQYTREASWLNMLVKADDNMKDIRKTLNLRMEEFYQHVGELLTFEKEQQRITGKFPTNYVKLKDRLRKYRSDKYASLISDHYGNKRAAKVNDDFSESLLLEMISHPNQYDDVLVAAFYNKTAAERGYKIITPQTVGIWRRKKGFLVTAEREGWAQFDDRYRRQIAGRRPSAPLYLVESDDNHLDLFYVDLEDVTGSKHYHKYKAMVVVDSYNDYPLGYAYAEEITVELVKSAYVNAMYHIRELTGAWYLPHETRTDKWSIKSLKPFYESMGHYIETPVGSKKRGYIEQLFGTTHWKRCMKLGANNYTGNNITARHRGVNQEVLAANKKLYPTVQQEAVQQIETFFHRLRTIPATGTESKQQQWLAAWKQLEADEKKQITDEQFLQIFGIVHNPGGRQIRITNMGVTPQINGSRLIYEVPAQLHLESIGKAVNVIYDPVDMSRVLVTDGAGLRFMATTTQLAPKALRDVQPGDRTHLNHLLAQKKEQSGRVAAAGEKRRQVLYEEGIDPENLLQAGVMEKELKQLAEVSFQAGIRPELRQLEEPDADYDPFDQM